MPKKVESEETKHTWQFTRHFRKNAFGWKGSAPASERIMDTLAEIKSAAQINHNLAADGVALFIEKCWQALVLIDSSSGALGNTMYHALEELAALFSGLTISDEKRNTLIERIWQAVEEEDYGYYDSLVELWPQLCANATLAGQWADYFKPTVILVLQDYGPGGYFKGTIPCLACLVAAARYSEVGELLALQKREFFPFSKYRILALANQGKLEQALSECDRFEADPYAGNLPASLAEKLLLEAGRIEQAYERNAIASCMHATGLATFGAIRKKYPSIPPDRIIKDLIASDPDNPGRYFAAARKAGLQELALQIATTAPVEPKTLTTAAKQTLKSDAHTALQFGLLALTRLTQGYGYEITGLDVLNTFDATMDAAKKLNQESFARTQILSILKNDQTPHQFVTATLSRFNRLDPPKPSPDQTPPAPAPTTDHEAKILHFKPRC